MNIFYIWNPIIVPRQPKTMEFVVTRGEAFSLNKGTKKFFQTVFEALEIEAKVDDWKIKMYRSKYYTDYLGEDDWRDNWQIIWRVRVTANSNIKSLPNTDEPWIGIDETDTTWETAPDDDDETVGCLVVADFEKKSELENAKKRIREDNEVKKMQKKYSVGEPEFAVSETMGLYPQLQIDLGDFPGKFFARDADYAEYVMELCRKENATTHFAERPE